ncbi:hypothetical protein PAAG_02946 [Paracoccidioides lutzii Pb01]|uniref:Uncharacterized protein n=1 Tax=Paracoccidioides lutzii (strain ATCC MYA-826 / Pb01) TaxID=502779 RepID=C1GWQ1_PARBA|nr:hypothetical protein PAAG_02946 [Paracoccidioides lutzii Pb01]EEH40970.2 hypothetical protein PAAG_02946 [Paracoccidioides lutzii Pb01]
MCATRLGGFSGQHPYSLTELPRSKSSQDKATDPRGLGERWRGFSPNDIESKTIRLIRAPVPRAKGLRITHLPAREPNRSLALPPTLEGAIGKSADWWVGDAGSTTVTMRCIRKTMMMTMSLWGCGSDGDSQRSPPPGPAVSSIACAGDPSPTAVIRDREVAESNEEAR